MSNKPADTADTADPDAQGNPLCWSCRNATPLMCAWVRDAVKGQLPEYVEDHTEKVITRQSGGTGYRAADRITVKIVTHCRKHEVGGLPAIGQVWPA